MDISKSAIPRIILLLSINFLLSLFLDATTICWDALAISNAWTDNNKHFKILLIELKREISTTQNILVGWLVRIILSFIHSFILVFCSCCCWSWTSGLCFAACSKIDFMQCAIEKFLVSKKTVTEFMFSINFHLFISSSFFLFLFVCLHSLFFSLFFLFTFKKLPTMLSMWSKRNHIERMYTQTKNFAQLCRCVCVDACFIRDGNPIEIAKVTCRWW